MKQALCRFIYYKVLGWKAHVSIPDFDKCVFCAAPHTTNWDLFIGKLFISAIGRESGFMMKKEWFFFPLGILFRWMGGIPVRRDKHTSLVDQIIRQAKESKKFHLAITPPIRTGNGASTTSHKERKSPSCSWASITRRNASEPKNTCMPAETSNGTCAKSSSTSSRSKANIPNGST